MPTDRIRPTRSSPDYKRAAKTGGVNEAGALSDQGDGSYVRRKAEGAPLGRYQLEVPYVPPTADIATIVPGARLKQPTSHPPKHVTLAMSVPGKGKPKHGRPPTVTGNAVRAGSGTAAYTFAAPPSHGAVSGPTGPWSTVLKKLAIRVNDGHKHDDESRAYLYDLFADVYYAERPSAALTVGPESPVTSTSYPELTVALTALIEDWQDGSGPACRAEIAYQLRVFDAAQHAAPGFDPETSPCVWASQGLTAPLDYGDGATPSTEAEAEVPDYALPNGTYHAYARGRRNFKAAQYGEWTSLTFGINVEPPPAPYIATGNDADDFRTAIVVTPESAAGATDPLVTIQRSADAGATWIPVRGAELAPCTFGQQFSVFDYEAPRGVAVTYRASVEASFDGLQLVSDWAEDAPSDVLPVAGWNVKAPLDPTMNLLGAHVNADPEWTQEEDAATFRPIGRKFPVVVSMALGGADGSMTISTRSAADWPAIEALRDYAGTLLLESPYGWSRYIRINSRSWTESGDPSAPRRRVDVAFLEVDRP